MPVRVRLDPQLTEDCAPERDLGTEGTMTIEEVVDYIGALEASLRQCRARLQQIRLIEGRE